MKRKLIQRNKQFLSSRYGKYLDGNGSFQKLTCHNVYFVDGTDDLVFKRTIVKWQWFFNSFWMDGILRNMELDGELEEISALDRELGVI